MMDPSRQRGSRQHNGSARMERLMRLASDPNLRWADVPGGANLLNQIALNPDDSHLAELAELLAQRQLQQARSSNDPYYANYPPAGQAVYMPDWICLGRMLTGSLIGLPPALHTSNFLSVGRTGAGKTTLTKQQALQLMRRGYCVVVVDRKRHWRQLAAQAHGQGEVVVLRLKELKVAVTQPPPAVDPSRWANDITRVFGQSYGRYSAHRPLSQVITEAVRTRRDNNWPGFDELTNGLLRMKFGRGSRGWDYRESMYWVLVDARQHLGDVFDCAASDMLEKMFSRPGLFVIEAEGLPTAHLGFLIAYFQQWAYCWHLAGRGAIVKVQSELDIRAGSVR